MRWPQRATGTVEAQLRTIERDGGDGVIDFGGGTRLEVSSLDKAYFPEDGISKGALMRYYTRLWPVLQPVMKDRPLVLKRYPDGVGGMPFFQQNAGERVPEGVRTELVGTESDGAKARLIGGDLPTLLYTVQLGAIEVHPWLSRVSDLESTDRCLIDLDPGDDVPFAQVVELARQTLQIARLCNLPLGVKTSGSTGIHLVISLPPHTSYERSAGLARIISEVLVTHRPDLATVERSIRSRPPASIYVDALQNARGKSMASAYSARATAKASVSAPLRASELTSRLQMTSFTVKSMPARVRRRGDLWHDAMRSRPTSRELAQAVVAMEQVLNEVPAATRPGLKRNRTRTGGAGA